MKTSQNNTNPQGWQTSSPWDLIPANLSPLPCHQGSRTVTSAISKPTPKFIRHPTRLPKAEVHHLCPVATGTQGGNRFQQTSTPSPANSDDGDRFIESLRHCQPHKTNSSSLNIIPPPQRYQMALILPARAPCLLQVQ